MHNDDLGQLGFQNWHLLYLCLSFVFLYVKLILKCLDLESRNLEFYKDRMNGLSLRVSVSCSGDFLKVGSLEDFNYVHTSLFRNKQAPEKKKKWGLTHRIAILTGSLLN